MLDRPLPPGTYCDDEIGKLQAAIDRAYPPFRPECMPPIVADTALISPTIRPWLDLRRRARPLPVPLDANARQVRGIFGLAKKDHGPCPAQ